MALQYYLFITLVLLIILGIISKKVIFNKEKGILVPFISFSVFIVFSFWVYRSQTDFSSDSKFKNVSLAHLELTGYKIYKDTSKLQNIRLYENENGEYALFDERNVGNIDLQINWDNIQDTARRQQSIALINSNLKKPLFVSYDKAGQNYRLANATKYLKFDTRNNQFSIRPPDSLGIKELSFILDTTLVGKDKVLKYYFKIKLIKKDSGIVEGTTKPKYYKYGLPLLSIIEDCDKYLNIDNIRDYLKDAYILRENQNPVEKKNIWHKLLIKLHIEDKYKDIDKNKFVFFPGKEFYDAGIRVTHGETTYYEMQQTDTLYLNKSQYFYYGLGYSKTPKLKITDYNNKQDLLLEYKLKKKSPLPVFDSIKKPTLYFSTDLQDIVKNSDYYPAAVSLNGTYSNPKNINHIRAKMQYYIEPVLTKIKAQYSDLLSEKISYKNIEPNQNFELSLSKNPNITQVIKLSVPYYTNKLVNKGHWFFICFYIFVMLIGLIYYLKLNSDNSSFHMERSIIFSFLFESMVYIVLLAYLVVRFVLYTRLIAFPPLKDITYNEYIKITDLNNDNYNFLLLMVFGLLALRFVYLLITIIFKEKIETIKLKNINLPLIILALASIFLTPFFNTKFIFLNILTPLLVFIISDYLFSKFFKKPSNEFLRRLFSIAISTIIGGILLLLFDKGYLLIYILFVVTYTTLILLFHFFKEKDGNPEKDRNLAIGGILATFIIISLAYTNIEKGGIVSEIFKKTDSHRIAYRFDILNKDIGELLIDNEYQSNQSRLAEWAASSFWFTTNYLYERTNNVDETTHIDTYYSTKAGVSIVNQARDLVLLRYVIYEHGFYVPILLLAFLVVLYIFYLYYFIRQYDDTDRIPDNIIGKLAVPIVLLLMIAVNYIVYIVNINKFPFIGQDFLWMTLSGRSVILLSTFYFAILIFGNTVNEFPENINEKKFHSRIAFTGLIPAVFLIFALYLVSSSKQGMKELAKKVKNELPKKVKGDKKYNLDYQARQPIVALNNFANVFNRNFSSRQQRGNRIKSYSDLKQKIDAMRAVKTNDKEYKNKKPVISDFYNGSIGEILKRSMNEYETSIQNKSDTIASNYVKSALTAFFESKKVKDIENILTFRKFKPSLKGGYIYKLVVNNRYYTISAIFEQKNKPRWRGNLLATKIKPDYEIVDLSNDNNKIMMRDVEIGSNISIKELSLGRNNKNDASNANFYIYKFPRDWFLQEYTKEKKDLLVASLTDPNNTNVLISQLDTTITMPENKVFDFVLNRGNIIDWKSKNIKIRVDYNKGDYLAKIFNYNGKNGYYYPAGKDLMWAYNANNYLVNVPLDSIGKKEDIYTSIDIDLQKEILRLLRETPKTNNAMVSIGDGYGRIRALVDYNDANMAFRLDPNDPKDIAKKYEKLTFKEGGFTEAQVRGTRNLQVYAEGFGSTIKPTIYSAVTSQARINWEDIKVNNIIPAQNNIHTYFAGKTINNGSVYWTELPPEFDTINDLDNKEYLIESRNMYNAIVVTLGSYPKSTLQNGNRLNIERLFNTDNDAIDRERRFPRLHIDNSFYVFKENFTNEYKTEERNIDAILEIGLRDNYNFEVTEQKTIKGKSNFYKDYETYLGINDTVRKKNYKEYKLAYPYFFPVKQTFIRGNKEEVYNFIINPAKGGRPFRLTQIGMVLNTLRLYQLNNKLKFSFLDTIKNPNNLSFKIDSNWGSVINYHTGFLHNNLYLSMTRSLKDGTSKAIILKLDRNIQSLNGRLIYTNNNSYKFNYKGQDFYLYAKTGTSNQRTRSRKEDFSWLLIISNKDMSNTNAFDDEKPKIMVMHLIEVYSTERNWELRANLVKAILESKSFNKYFFKNQ